MKKSLLLLLLFTAISSLQSQSFQIMRYGIGDGLLHEATYALIQDEDGFIWISTSQGLSRLDGVNFTSVFPGNTLPTTIATKSYRDSRGRIWFGYLDGQIAVLDEGSFRVFSQEDTVVSSIAGFVEDREGNILSMTQQHGMIHIDKDFHFQYTRDPFKGTLASDFLVTPEGNLLIGAFNGVLLYTKTASGSYENAGRIAGVPFTRIQDIKPGMHPGTYWLGTEDEGLYRITGLGNDPAGYQVVQMGVERGLKYSSISAVLVDPAGYLWVSDYGKGVYRFSLNDDGSLGRSLLFDVEGGMPEEYIKDVIRDDEGNMWFASQSNGVAILRDQAFTFYNVFDGRNVPEISAISIHDGDYWLGSRNGELYLVSASLASEIRSFKTSEGLPGAPITALWHDENRNLYIGTENSGVYFLDISTQRIRKYFTSENSLGNMINDIDGSAHSVWIATNDGIYEIVRSTGEIRQQTTLTGLPHNIINDVLVDQEGRAWIATRGSGLYCVSNDSDRLNFTIRGNPKLEFVALTQDKDGAIWGATSEYGVIKFSRDTLEVFSVDRGLKAKYTYAVEVDQKGFVWVGHRLGLSKIDPANGNIVVFDQEMGFTSDILPRAIVTSDEGLLLFGTNNGLIVYDTEQARPDTVPPRLNITQLSISDSLYSIQEEIRLPYGLYKMQVDFIGINLTNPDQVTYQYKLEGFDDWSEPTRETFAKYSRLEDGEYTFMLKAIDGNGNSTGEVAMFHLSIKIPIWKAWWFILSLVIIAIGSVYLIIKVRERNQKALQEYLEQQLEERTREVIHQKEEIEIKNRDITDSINYAQRIQASILPSTQRLQEIFSGSFVFYQPRDIVSGDFYWYDRIDDDRFVIVCADSTGHGVPGAFMSMIGTTLIKDICLRSGITTPSEVLQTLDKEVREALNQNTETDGSNDGMDIIVAEINLKTNRFMVSSAMRPVILYRGGEQIYVKGSRSSVGGQLDETSVEKEFTNEVFDLNKGDIVYMFSDGYPDQFGGPLGRKFKMVRLKNLLRDIHDKPMEEQHNYVKSNFFLWKEDLEQVDDVLFMGIKI
ncbi:MAG: SpoIIE family protein phosphatase [Bacteroidales bacterium]|nr:SpoIIE family protein phosphatase [Bacteroidales bacterium]MDT8431837.1 SpoIIE family protein phosphatase [Bacteroidales bacterium]